MPTARLARACALIATSALVLTILNGGPANAAAIALHRMDDVSSHRLSYYNYVQKAYGASRSLARGDSPAAHIAALKAAITEALPATTAEIDDAATPPEIAACVRSTIEVFQRINEIGADGVRNLATAATGCVSLAKDRIYSAGDREISGVQVDRITIDKLGFAVNAVGPMALAARTLAAMPNDVAKQQLIDANQQVRTRLTPECAPRLQETVGIVDGRSLDRWRGFCRGYRSRSGPVGEGSLPWTVDVTWYNACPGDDLCQAFRRAQIPQLDYLIAINQAMRSTSYPHARAALAELRPEVAALGSPIATTARTSNMFAPMEAFGVGAGDSVFRSVLTPVDSTAVTFSGWNDLAGSLRSVAAASNSDGRVELFGIDKVGDIFHRWQQVSGDNNSWSPWAQMDGQLSSIAVSRNHNGTLQIFGATRAEPSSPEIKSWAGTNQSSRFDFSRSPPESQSIPGRRGNRWTGC